MPPIEQDPGAEHSPLLSPNYAATASPIYRAVWGEEVSCELFRVPAAEPRSSEPTRMVVDASLSTLRRHFDHATLYGADGRLSEALLNDLSTAGYWGVLIGSEFGGAGATLQHFVRLITRVAAIEPSVANLASVHGCLGAPGVLRSFGSVEQRRRWLPQLVRGERLSAFALTEPDAGSDVSALSTVARREGDRFFLSGTKVFITNLAPGRTLALVCRIENRPAMLIVDLPDDPAPGLQFVNYGLHAARRSGNRGVTFQDFEVPTENLIVLPKGDGLTIAYYGLNRGRMSLCAVAAGTLRRILAGLLLWVRTRRTYGKSIGERELIQRRLGRLTSLIVGCDALSTWCASLLDAGYRGELECMVAKIFASEAQKEAAIEIALKTHGGRSFLQGHPLGDSLHDLLAPCIYEGESEILSLAFFHTLSKQNREPREHVVQNKPPPESRLELSREWQSHMSFAIDEFPRAGQAIERMSNDSKAGGFLDGQCVAVGLARRVQHLTTIACLADYARQQADPFTKLAGLSLADDLQREVNGRLPSGADFARQVALGRQLLAQDWRELAETPVDGVLHPQSISPRVSLDASH